jgi:hypothetical protein
MVIRPIPHVYIFISSPQTSLARIPWRASKIITQSCELRCFDMSTRSISSGVGHTSEFFFGTFKPSN